MTRQQSTVALAVLVVLAIGVVVGLAPHADPYFDDDSTAYIEAGRYFAEGRGFVIWPYGPEHYDWEFVPLQLFPPGFPLLVSIGVFLGATAEAAATWIPRACFVLLPLILYGVLRFVMGRIPALVATVISCFLPPVVFHSMCAMSDVPFLLFVLMGFLCLFRGVSSGRNRWLVAAGLLAGAAAGIRNAGYAVPVAVTGAFLLAGHGRRAPLYLAGFVVSYAPVVLRNLVLFGSVQPYSMPPSGLSVAAVLRETLRAFDDMFVANTVPWPVLASAFFALSVGTAVWLLRSGIIRQLRTARRADLLAGTVLLLYAVITTGMILITRFRFDVDPINARFLIQVHWVFVAWCVLVGAASLRLVRPQGPRVRAALSAAILAVLLAPQVPVARMQAAHMSWSRGIAADHAALRDLIVGLPDDTCVAAFHAPQLHLMYDRPVYQLPPVSPARASAFVGERPLVVVMFPYEYEQFHEWWGVFDGELPPGFKEIGRSGRVIALHSEGD